MTITTTYQQDGAEPLPETIRALIARQWNITPRPKIYSAFGVDGNTATPDSPLTENDFAAIEKKEDAAFIRIFGGDNTVDASDNTFVEITTSVFIDVFGPQNQIHKFIDEIDRIIFENQPNASTRIKKSDNIHDSAIISFDQYVIDWQRIPEELNVGLVEQFAGQIDITWQKTKS